MAQRPPSMLRHELIALRRSLAEANDRKVMHVIGALDEIAAGAAADHLIDPVRPRLVKLRPARRLRFARLLFAPLDPLIVLARQWKPGTPTVPRTVLEPLARTVRAALGPAVEPIDAAIAGRTTRDAAAVTRAGELLWPLAAGILTDPPPPIGWAATGLKQGAYAPLAHAVGAVLARLPRLQDLERDADNGIQPPVEAIQAILDGVAAETPQAQGMTVALLLARLPQAGPVVRRRAAGNAVLCHAEGQAIAALIDGLESTGAIESQVLGAELAETASEVRRVAALLVVLEGDSPTPERRGRLLSLSHRLDAACRAQFADGLASEFLAPLRKSQAFEPVAQAVLETTARRLRALETEGRRLGGGDTYDAQLRQAAASVTGAGTADALGLVHKVRLVEILAGPEAALALLESADV